MSFFGNLYNSLKNKEQQTQRAVTNFVRPATSFVQKEVPRARDLFRQAPQVAQQVIQPVKSFVRQNPTPISYVQNRVFPFVKQNPSPMNFIAPKVQQIAQNDWNKSPIKTNLIPTIRNITPAITNDIGKAYNAVDTKMANLGVNNSFFKPTSDVRFRDFARELPNAAYTIAKSIPQSIVAGSKALTMKPGDKFTPSTNFEKAVYGENPVVPAKESTFSFGGKVPALGIGMTALGVGSNFIPGLGGDSKILGNSAKIIADTSDVATIAKTLRASKVAEKDIPELANTLKNVTKPAEVLNSLKGYFKPAVALAADALSNEAKLIEEAKKYKTPQEFADYYVKNQNKITKSPEYTKYLQEKDAFDKRATEIYSEMQTMRDKYAGKTIKDVSPADMAKYDNLQQEVNQTLSKKTLAPIPEGTIKTIDHIGEKGFRNQLDDIWKQSQSSPQSTQGATTKVLPPTGTTTQLLDKNAPKVYRGTVGQGEIDAIKNGTAQYTTPETSGIGGMWAKTPQDAKKYAEGWSGNVGSRTFKPKGTGNYIIEGSQLSDGRIIPTKATDIKTGEVIDLTKKGANVPLTPKNAQQGIEPLVGQGGKGVVEPTGITTTPETNRGFLKSVQETTNPIVKPELKQVATELTQTRPVITNKQSITAATDRINQGIDQAHKYVLSPITPDAEKVTTAQLLIGKYSDSGQLDKASEVLDSMTSQLTKSGQAVQAASLIDKLSPQNIVKLADNEATKVGQTLDKGFRQQLIKRATDIQKMSAGQDKTIAINQLYEDVAKQLPPTPSEWLKNYRYQNMLSSPTPLEKIGMGGLTNTLITRPAELFGQAVTNGIKHGFNSNFERQVYFSDIPRHYKDVLIGLPNAWEAAVGAFKSGSMERTFEEGVSGSSTIGKLRQKNIPTILRPFTSAHGAIYSYFSSLISGAEKSRLMAHGVSEAEATLKATALGEKLTLRSPLGKGEMSTAVQLIDSLGQVPKLFQKVPVLGEATRWIAPFMRVSTNWAKLAVEHSPLNLIGKPTTETVGNALVGSIMTGIGADLVMKDRVTLGVPTDSKEQELFYASGRKPYSILIGKTWVPMTYFGAFSLNFMLPAMVKDAMSGTNAPKDVPTKVMTGLGDTGKFILANTPLPSIAGFFNLLSGDTSVNFNTIGANLVSQVIPLEALLRYAANVVDPVYHKTNSLIQKVEVGIPTMAKNFPTYNLPTGQPETRNPADKFLPYPIGTQNNQFEPALQSRQQTLNANAILNAANKSKDQSGTPNIQGGQQVSNKIWTLPDGTFAYQIDDQFKQTKSQSDAQQAIDGNNFAKSGKNTQVINNKVFKKADNTNGYTTQPKIQYDADLLETKKTSLKNKNDIKGWLDNADALYQNYQTQLQDQTLDDVEKMKIQNKIDSLVTEANKYAGYGGFTKGKKASTAKVKAAITALKAFKAPKFTVPASTVKIPTTRVSGVKTISAQELAKGR